MSYTLKKSLGQHFLHDETISKKIVASLIAKNNIVTEIGPGGGAITKYLIERQFESFQCIEIDKEKVDYLIKTYPTLKNNIIHSDILQLAMQYPQGTALIGNFPYNISSQIMFHILEHSDAIHEVVGMFQKEVAQRIASAHGSKVYGILSVLTQCFYDIDYLFDVAPSSFTPPPNVNSGVIRLQKKENPFIKKEDYKKFKTLVKASFNQRRKTLRNSLKSFYPIDLLQGEVFSKRAEQLAVGDFVGLFHTLQSA
ncbi:MAG: 16S rRNA (adenine(1518)-N(6)/adenine(1519)-N(6))-dimethyltransferase RsmA [Chitinophagaceae bacterium]